MKRYIDRETNKHLYQNHIDIKLSEMRSRILRGLYDSVDGIVVATTQSLVSKFLSEDIANNAIEACIQANQNHIDFWMKEKYEKRIVFEYFSTEKLGFALAQGTDFNNKYAMYGIRLVLEDMGNYYRIVNAYPIPNKQLKQRIARDRKLWNIQRKERH